MDAHVLNWQIELQPNLIPLQYRNTQTQATWINVNYYFIIFKHHAHRLGSVLWINGNDMRKFCLFLSSFLVTWPFVNICCTYSACLHSGLSVQHSIYSYILTHLGCEHTLTFHMSSKCYNHYTHFTHCQKTGVGKKHKGTTTRLCYLFYALCFQLLEPQFRLADPWLGNKFLCFHYLPSCYPALPFKFCCHSSFTSNNPWEKYHICKHFRMRTPPL